MRNKIPFLVFLLILLIDLMLFSLPKYNTLVKREKEYRMKRLELQNLVESMSILRETLERINEKRKFIFQEKNFIFLTMGEIPIFFKDLSEIVKKCKIKSFEIRPGDFETIQDLPNNFPLKMKNLPINLRLAGSYNQFIDFFREIYNCQYPISFRQIQFINDSNYNFLVFSAIFDVYVLEGGE